MCPIPKLAILAFLLFVFSVSSALAIWEMDLLIKKPSGPSAEENTTQLPGWSYRKPIMIFNPGSALTDYQISVSQDTSSLIGSIFYELPISISSTGTALTDYQVSIVTTNSTIINHITSDGRDIRFFNQPTASPYSTTTGKLNFWIESISPSQLKIWVKVDSIPASGGKTIYMYYGNPSASSLSSFTETMLVLSSNPSFTTYGSWSPSTYNTQTNPGNTLVSDGSYGYMYTGDAWTAQDEGCYWIWDFGSSASRSFYIKWYDSATVVSGYCMSFTTYVYVSPDGSSWTLIASNTLSGTGTSQVFTSNYNGTYRYVRVQQYSTTSCMVYGYTYVDGVWARTYSSTEPTASVGSENVKQIGQSKMKSDCGDIRFTDNDGTTKLSYWLESGCNSASTKIWVKVPSVPSGSKTIYMYYGNPFASSTSNGTATFIFFDDFSGTTINTTKWSKTDPSGYITQNGQLIISNGPATWGNTEMHSVQNFARDSIVAQAKYRSTCEVGATYQDTTMLWWKDSTTGTSYTDFIYALYFYRYGGSNVLTMYEDGFPRSLSDTWTCGTQYWVRQILKPAGGATTDISTDGTTWTTKYDSSYSTETPLKVGFTHYQGGYIYMDDFIVRKYVSPEPYATNQEISNIKQCTSATGGDDTNPFICTQNYTQCSSQGTYQGNMQIYENGIFLDEGDWKNLYTCLLDCAPEDPIILELNGTCPTGNYRIDMSVRTPSGIEGIITSCCGSTGDLTCSQHFDVCCEQGTYQGNAKRYNDTVLLNDTGWVDLYNCFFNIVSFNLTNPAGQGYSNSSINPLTSWDPFLNYTSNHAFQEASFSAYNCGPCDSCNSTCSCNVTPDYVSNITSLTAGTTAVCKNINCTYNWTSSTKKGQYSPSYSPFTPSTACYKLVWKIKGSEANKTDFAIFSASTSLLCGNGVIDPGENCLNCPDDAGCLLNQLCQGNGSCGTTPSGNCNSNSTCDFNESCDCSDCYGKQDGCILGDVCSSSTQRCGCDSSSNGVCTSDSNCQTSDPDCRGGPSCTCGNWYDIGCGLSPCSSTQRKQTRDCDPDGCAIETLCNATSTCLSNYHYSADVKYFNVFWLSYYSESELNRNRKIAVACTFNCDPRTEDCTSSQKCSPYLVIQTPGLSGCSVINPVYRHGSQKDKIVCRVYDPSDPTKESWY